MKCLDCFAAWTSLQQSLIDSQREEIERLQEQLCNRRVDCACGKDTADIRYAKCYNCRQEATDETKLLLALLKEIEELPKTTYVAQYYDKCDSYGMSGHTRGLQQAAEIAKRIYKKSKA